MAMHEGLAYHRQRDGTDLLSLKFCTRKQAKSHNAVTSTSTPFSIYINVFDNVQRTTRMRLVVTTRIIWYFPSVQ